MPTKFDFLSPGIELREIDQSAIAAVPENDGLLLIGRAKKGPAMKPIKITSLADFQSVFGTPMDGVKRGDPWREGNTGGGGWAAYAAEAYLAADVGPVKFIRLAGVASDDAATDDNEKAGWFVPTNTDAALGTGISAEEDIEGAIGIFVAEDSALVGSVGASAILTITDQQVVLSQFAINDTIEIEFVGGSYTFIFTAAATSGLNIQLSTVVGETAASAAGVIEDAITNYLNSQNSAVDFTAVDNTDGTITLTQLTLGTVGDTLAIDVSNTSAASATAFAGGADATNLNGVLAAIIYSSGSNVTLSGTARDGTTSLTDKTAHAIKSTNGSWSAELQSAQAGDNFSFNFNFEPTSQNFIRNVLSTDATLFGSDWNGHKIFLGESFENNVNRLSGDLVAWTAALKETGKNFTDHREELSPAKTGWFIGSNASNYKRLFRLAALDEGSDFHKSHIVRIKDLRKATTVRPEGSFTIEIARAGQRPSEYVEKFVNVTLNPDSPNYILKKIGDLKQEWDSTKGKIVSTGSFNNESNLIRVELAEGGVNKTDLPLGFLGPAEIDAATVAGADTTKQNGFVRGAQSLPGGTASQLVDGLFTGDSITVSWPTHQLSVANSSANGANYAPTALHGLSYEAQRGNEDFADIGILKSDYDPHLAYTAAATDAAYTFSLEHIVEDGSTGTYYLDTASSPTVTAFDDAAGALALGIKQFAAPFFGGTDGVDITIENPFNNTELSTGYAKYSMESAISQVADYYTSRYDLISIPGVTNSAINSLLVRQTEERGDALAIIDMKGIYVSEIDNGNGEVPGSVSTMVSTAETGIVASSYAAAYYPNVRIADVSSGRGSVLMAPPSVAAIGAIAKSEAVSQPWFAPAGFNRGGLAPLGGTGGASVVGTLEHLSKADRDDLYNVNINPIARFPATGDTVIFGQKTLQPTDTALDRINVRRMMIYLKKRIGGIADQFLFEQGVKATYDSFKAQINPVLLQVKNEFGITDYKVVLDESTTTPDLQDRNIMYAKVFVKPAKAIEYVVIDFVVTQSGVEF
jgi:hypothetical protein